MARVDPPRIAAPPAGSILNTVLLAAIAVAALYFAREVLIPIALAVLLSFVIAPLTRLFRSWYVPRILAVAISVLIAFAVIFSIGALMVSQVNQLAQDLPRYQSTLREKIQSLRGAAAGSGALERASEVLVELGKELDRPPLGRPGAGPSSSGDAVQKQPIPVEVREPQHGALQTLVSLIGPLLHPLTTTGIVIIFLIFILMQREDLRNRMIRLAGAGDLQRTTAALDDAGRRLSRLFLAQLGLNAAFGIVVGLGLFWIGVPSAPLWGILAMILRFVPYIGALISAILPITLAAAVGPDWSMVLWTAGLFIVVEPIVGQVLEPAVYGHSTGLSPVAVVAAVAFWTWLWGPIGLILATPITMCLVVLGRHVDQLKFLDIMFGQEPALKPEELAYQRMLAGDPIEASEQARQILKKQPLLAYYDNVLAKALTLAQADADRGQLDDERKERIRDTVAEVLDDLEGYEDKPRAPPPDEKEGIEAVAPENGEEDEPVGAHSEAVPEEWRDKQRVLCIPGRDLLGEALALVVAQLLTKEGVGARAEESNALSVSRLFDLDTEDVRLVCLCFVGPATAAQVGYAIRRLRRKLPEAPILLVLIGPADDSIAEDLKPVLGSGSVQTTLSDTRDEVLRIVKSAPEPVSDRPTRTAAE